MTAILLIHIIVIALAIGFAIIGVRTIKKGKKHRINYAFLISFFIMLIFLGLRVSLGRDWDNYERIFTSALQQEFSFGESREIGFLLLVKFLRFLGLEFQSFIFVSSFIMLFLFYISYRKFYYLLPLGLFVFFIDWGYPVVINTIRQGIALMAFLNASLYIDSKEKHAGWKFISFILFGLLFHYTILMFVPFYYIGKLKFNFFYFSCILLAIFVISIFVIMPMYEETMSLVEKYENYANATYIVNEKSSFGLGATLVLLIRIAPFFIYTYVSKKHPEFLKYFVLYFIGLSVYYGFYKFMLITRVTFYLQFMALFVMAYFIYFLFVEKKQYRIIGIGYVFLILFNYVYTFKDFLVDQLVSNRFSLMFTDLYFKE